MANLQAAKATSNSQAPNTNSSTVAVSPPRGPELLFFRLNVSDSSTGGAINRDGQQHTCARQGQAACHRTSWPSTAKNSDPNRPNATHTSKGRLTTSCSRTPGETALIRGPPFSLLPTLLPPQPRYTALGDIQLGLGAGKSVSPPHACTHTHDERKDEWRSHVLSHDAGGSFPSSSAMSVPSSQQRPSS